MERKNLKNTLIYTFLVLIGSTGYAQNSDSISLSPKVKHMEPLYIDLVRDLGARKGEKEFNLGSDFLNTNNYREYAVLAEYEFAPIDRLGLEIETDFSFYDKTNSESQIPENKLDKLILSAQYSFFVSPKYQTTMAIGYAHEFELTDFNSYDSAKFVTGMVYKPFFVAAKKWGESFHTLIFTGPMMSHNFDETYTSVDWQINTSLHYNIPNTHHFIGVEFNKEVVDSEFEMTMRPQLKLQLNEAFAVGLVAGFPIDNEKEKFSSFFRLIYEL